jgi:hypothetical protein
MHIWPVRCIRLTAFACATAAGAAVVGYLQSCALSEAPPAPHARLACALHQAHCECKAGMQGSIHTAAESIGNQAVAQSTQQHEHHMHIRPVSCTRLTAWASPHQQQQQQQQEEQQQEQQLSGACTFVAWDSTSTTCTSGRCSVPGSLHDV